MRKHARSKCVFAHFEKVLNNILHSLLAFKFDHILLTAIYNLYLDNWLPENFLVMNGDVLS